MSLSFATIKAQLLADKKKATILGVLFLILVIATGRLFVGESKPTPAVAVAVVPPTGVAPASTPEPALIRPTPEKVDETLPVAPPAAGTPAPVRPRMTDSKRVAVDGMPRTPTRDLFATPAWDKFPRSPSIVDFSSKKSTPKGPGFLETIQKQLRDYRAAQHEEAAKFESELVGLELQSTMTGPVRSAYISGRLVHEGDIVNGFLILKISNREVFLGRNGATGRIWMR